VKTYAIVYQDFEELETFQSTLVKSLDQAAWYYHSRVIQTPEATWVPIKIGTTEALQGLSLDGYTPLPSAIMLMDSHKAWFNSVLMPGFCQIGSNS